MCGRPLMGLEYSNGKRSINLQRRVMNSAERNLQNGPSSNGPSPPQEPSKSFDDIREWLVVHVARELELSASQIDVRQPLRRFGLDSLAAAGLSGELEIWLGRDLPADLLNDYPTIQAMAEYLAGASVETASSRPSVLAPTQF